jgi:hypothetical protein
MALDSMAQHESEVKALYESESVARTSLQDRLHARLEPSLPPDPGACAQRADSSPRLSRYPSSWPLVPPVSRPSSEG